MPGKRVQFDETWEAIGATIRDSGSSFQELADEAFADLLKKRKRPVGLMESLKERPHAAVASEAETHITRVKYPLAIMSAWCSSGSVRRGLPRRGSRTTV